MVVTNNVCIIICIIYTKDSLNRKKFTVFTIKLQLFGLCFFLFIYFFNCHWRGTSLASNNHHPASSYIVLMKSKCCCACGTKTATCYSFFQGNWNRNRGAPDIVRSGHELVKNKSKATPSIHIPLPNNLYKLRYKHRPRTDHSWNPDWASIAGDVKFLMTSFCLPVFVAT